MTTLAEVAASVRSLRDELTEFVEGALQDQDEISVEKLVRLAYKQFKDDEWMREALIREALNTLIPTIAAHVRHEHRTRARQARTAGELRRERMASVFEHTGKGISKSFLAMKRPDHIYALQERETAVAGHMRWIGLHREVIALHKDDETTTGQLPATQISALWRKYIEQDD